MDEPATEEWIRERWGGFSYLVIGRNEDFTLEFFGPSLWLRYENEARQSPVGMLLLIESPTRQQVIEVEKLFGCIK